MKKILKVIAIFSVLLTYQSMQAESLSNVTETNKDMYLKKNIDNAKWISKEIKQLERDIKIWYKTNNIYIEYLPWLWVKKVDFFWWILIIVAIMYWVIKILTKRW